MLKIRLIIVLLLIGCGKPSPPSQHIQADVNSWANMGMYLPKQEQIDFIHANLDAVAPELQAAVSSKNADIRQRAAYVIAEIGPDANELGNDLFEQLKKEKVQIVQMYLADAIAAVRFNNEKVFEYLKTKYEVLNDKNVPLRLFGVNGGNYPEVDEKINLAGVLFVLADESSQGKYSDFVVQWLSPPNDQLSPGEVSGYWERRWMAVNVLEDMKEVPEAIPLLETMLKEENSQPWVFEHVPRVLDELKKHQ